jgi:competence protein ComEA
MHRFVASLILVAVLFALQAHAQQTPVPAAAAANAAVMINLNTASSTELQTLPGIGEKTAARIIEHRQKNGPFKKIEELMNVPGIGEKVFLKLKPQLTVAAKPGETPGQK